MLLNLRYVLCVAAVGLVLAWPLSAHAAKTGRKNADGSGSYGKVSKIITGASSRDRQWHSHDEQNTRGVRHLDAQEQREEDGPPPPPPSQHGRRTPPPEL